MAAKLTWSGVYPAATTQFTSELALDLPATQKVQSALIDDGVDGIIVAGTVGENNSLEPEEKRAALKAGCEVAAGRVSVIVGVSELTTKRAIAFARDAEQIGADALMVLPAMVYVPTDEELYTHFKAVAEATSLPVMLYNNPPAYRVSISMEVLRKLSSVANIVAIKESAPDPRRFTDVFNAFGDRFTLVAGLDDIALEGLLLGAKGWVSGLTNAFPRESVALVAAVRKGDLATALSIYRWFMPLLHLDARPDLVQCIKLCEEIMGRGSALTRPPRLALAPDERAEVEVLMERALAARPRLPDVGLAA